MLYKNYIAQNCPTIINPKATVWDTEENLPCRLTFIPNPEQDQYCMKSNYIIGSSTLKWLFT